MRFFRSAIFVVLACGLVVSPLAQAATRRHTKRHAKHVTHRRSAHRSKHHTSRASKKEVIARQSDPKAAPKNVAAKIPPIPMKNGHLYVPPPMRGSHAILVRQNRRNDAEDLSRIQNRSQLEAMRRAGYLTDLPDTRELEVSAKLPEARQCARPWTVAFLKNLAHAHYVRFHSSLKVTSAVRTAAYQKRLMRVNANAAPVRGMTASPHLTGAAVDISKKGLSLREIAWMRAYLLPLEEERKIDVEEEFYQACFHINVYKSYVAKPKRKRRSPATLLAAGVR